MHAAGVAAMDHDVRVIAFQRISGITGHKATTTTPPAIAARPVALGARMQILGAAPAPAPIDRMDGRVSHR